MAMVTITQVRKGIQQYIDEQILPHLNTAKRFGVSVYMQLVLSQIQCKITQYLQMPAIKLLGIIDDHGNVDIDRLYDAATKRLAQDDSIQLSLPLVGCFIFRRPDIDNLYELIRRSRQ